MLNAQQPDRIRTFVSCGIGIEDVSDRPPWNGAEKARGEFDLWGGGRTRRMGLRKDIWE